jgi:hypothetical protein
MNLVVPKVVTEQTLEGEFLQSCGERSRRFSPLDWWKMHDGCTIREAHDGKKISDAPCGLERWKRSSRPVKLWRRFRISLP